jgi:hypothetical protein
MSFFTYPLSRSLFNEFCTLEWFAAPRKMLPAIHSTLAAIGATNPLLINISNIIASM